VVVVVVHDNYFQQHKWKWTYLVLFTFLSDYAFEG
jgi:hypothetical protein